jgi:hypothetical protein
MTIFDSNAAVSFVKVVSAFLITSRLCAVKTRLAWLLEDLPSAEADVSRSPALHKKR